MAIALGKGQIEYAAKDIRAQLQSIGDEQREAARKQARERFFKTKEGKMIQHLRVVFGREGRCGNLAGEVVSAIEDKAMKGLEKPFQYISLDEMCKEVARASMKASTSEEMIDMVKQIWYRRLKPSVRKKFNIKLS